MIIRGVVNKVLSRAGVSVQRWPPPHSVMYHLRATLAREQVDCVLDVGANRGQFARALREEARFKGWVVSFEPHPDLVGPLAAAAEYDPLWRVEPYALGRERGELPFYPTAVSDQSSFLEPTDFGREVFALQPGERGPTLVPVRALADALPDVLRATGARRPFLKIDTQGFDLEVLAGAKAVWEQLAGVMVETTLTPSYEGQPVLAESIEALHAAGFGITGLYPGAGAPRNRLVEFDLVAVRD